MVYQAPKEGMSLDNISDQYLKGTELCVLIQNDSFLHLHREVADEAHPLEGHRYHTHENGTLEIYRTTEEDAGSYSCWVDNAMGKAVITANLDIRSIVILPLLS